MRVNDKSNTETALFGKFLFQDPKALAPMRAALLTGGYTGLLGGLTTAIFDGHTKAHTALSKRVHAYTSNIGYYALVGFGFAFVQSTARELRGKKTEDFVSSFAGGATAGFIMGAKGGRLSGMLIMPPLVGLVTGTLTGMGVSLARDDKDFGQPSPVDLQHTLIPRSAADLEGMAEERARLVS